MGEIMYQIRRFMGHQEHRCGHTVCNCKGLDIWAPIVDPRTRTPANYHTHGEAVQDLPDLRLAVGLQEGVEPRDLRVERIELGQADPDTRPVKERSTRTISSTEGLRGGKVGGSPLDIL